MWWDEIFDNLVDMLLLFVSPYGFRVGDLLKSDFIRLIVPAMHAASESLHLLLDSTVGYKHHQVLKSLLYHDRKSDNLDFTRFVIQALYNPRSLKTTTRAVIFNCLRVPKTNKVKDLQLPVTLQRQIVLWDYKSFEWSLASLASYVMLVEYNNMW